MEITSSRHTKNLNRVRIAIEADSHEALTKKCLVFNFKHNKEFDYSPYVKDGKTWYTSFYATLEVNNDVAK